MSEAAALVDAAYAGDLATVNSLLATAAGRATIDEPDGRAGYTALIWAALLGHTPVVEALLGAGADATVEDDDGNTALRYAAGNGRTPTVLALLRAQPGEALARADRERALELAGRFGHAAAAHFLCQSLGRPFGPEQLTEVKQNVLTYGPIDPRPLGGEQGTILVAVLVALISCCALPQGRGWGTEGESVPGEPDLPVEEYDPPLDALPCSYFFLRNLGNRRSICTVWIQDIDQAYGLDWFGHWTDNVVRAVVAKQRLLCLHWPTDAITATYGEGVETEPFVSTEEEATEAAQLLDARLSADASHNMAHHVLTAAELAAPGNGFFNPLCWGFAQMQEMRFVLEHFADLCDIMPSDAVQEGDAGRNDPAATWTYMAGRLQKMGGGRTGRNRSYKERTFELGKNELRYKAGATKGGSWQTIDLSGGTVMAGKGYRTEMSSTKGKVPVWHTDRNGKKTKKAREDDSKKDDAITLVDAQGRTWELRAPTPVQANNWGVAIETRTGCESVGKSEYNNWY